MINTKNICRICSSRADYDIFSVIPAYVHASPNEFLQWRKDISQLLEDVTGLTVTKDDGLPQKICALCISYLKHAVTFRQQAIDNILSLKAAEAAMSTEKLMKVAEDRIMHIDDSKTGETEGKPFDDIPLIDVTADDLIYNNKRKTDTNSLIMNNVFNNQTKNDDYFKKILLFNNKSRKAGKQQDNSGNDRDQETNHLKTYLNLLFDKDTEKAPYPGKSINNHASGNAGSNNMNLESFVTNFWDENDLENDDIQTASSDDNEYEQKMNYFNYKEKNFEEDDIMALDVLKEANIIVNIPEHFKERKCRACCRRFMFEESYNEHMNTCLENKFLLLIEEINRLLVIRRSKAISPHEFIRRMIFCLKKTCQWLSASCGEDFLPDLVNGEMKKRTKSEGKSSGAENSSLCRSDDSKIVSTQFKNVDKLDVEMSDTSFLNTTVVELNKTDTNDNPLLKLLKEKADPILLNNLCSSPCSDPLLERLRSTPSKMICSTPIMNLDSCKSDGGNSDSSFAYMETENARNKRAFTLNTEIERKSLLESFNRVADKEDLFLPVSPTMMPIPPMHPKPTFSTRCNACDKEFDHLSSLEEHNARFHNSPNQLSKHKEIIALFESEDYIGTDEASSTSSRANTALTNLPIPDQSSYSNSQTAIIYRGSQTDTENMAVSSTTANGGSAINLGNLVNSNEQHYGHGIIGSSSSLPEQLSVVEDQRINLNKFKEIIELFESEECRSKYSASVNVLDCLESKPPAFRNSSDLKNKNSSWTRNGKTNKNHTNSNDSRSCNIVKRISGNSNGKKSLSCKNCDKPFSTINNLD